MLLVDVLVSGFQELPPVGGTGSVNGVSMSTGGDALNEAITLAKLGVSVGVWGLLGQDQQADFRGRIKSQLSHFCSESMDGGEVTHGFAGRRRALVVLA